MALSVIELRIGNYIEYFYPHEQEWGIHNVLIEDFEDVEKEYFRPIPLTEEWLLRFGFDRKCDYEQQDWQWGKLCSLNTRRGVGLYNYTGDKYIDYWCVTFREDVGCGWSDLNEIEYVHQLQNLYFALTGEELEIKKG